MFEYLSVCFLTGSVRLMPLPSWRIQDTKRGGNT